MFWLGHTLKNEKYDTYLNLNYKTKALFVYFVETKLAGNRTVKNKV